MTKLLLVEDDTDICEIIKLNLTYAGYDLVVTHSACEAFKALEDEKFDLILLDVMLPGLTGIEICRKIRKYNFSPIIFISCLDDEKTIIDALEMGGDDYIVKPFNFPILQAKIETLLRRSKIPVTMEYDGIIKIRDLIVNQNNHSVLKGIEPIYLSPLEFKILLYLIHNPNKIISQEEIYNNIWEEDSFGDVRTVKVHVSNLRKKLEIDSNNPEYIKTVKRKGYVFPIE